MLRVIEKAPNLSLNVVNIGEVVNDEDGKMGKRLKGIPFLFVGVYCGVSSEIDYFTEHLRSYHRHALSGTGRVL
jgi:hypothetical protein